MLDVFDFIEDKGGDLKKIKESQQRRYAPENAADEVIALYEDARKSEQSALPILLLFAYLHAPQQNTLLPN